MQRPPKYRKRIIRGREIAYLTLIDAQTRRRRDYWLGPYGTPRSRAAYARLLAAWEARGRRLPDAQGPRRPADGPTVTQLTARYWSTIPGRHSHTYIQAIKAGLRSFRRHYGREPVADIGPVALRTWRDAVAAEHSADWANRAMRHVVTMFRWGVAEEIVPVETYQRLKAVTPLRPPRRPPVGPAPDEAIDAVRAIVGRHVRAMLELQLCTGMRPGEVCSMRPCDLDMTRDVWTYRPAKHKTEHHGKARLVYLGPRAQGLLRPFLADRPTTAPVFSAAQAEAERRAVQHAGRKTPLSCGNRPGTNRSESPRRRASNRYTTDSYRRAIVRACDRAGVDRWHPHQLRHTYATEIRRQYGLEAARILLGHSSALVTEAVYAERDERAALRIAAEIG